MNERLVSLAVIAVLALAACGSAGASPAEPASALASATPATTATVGAAASLDLPDVATDFPSACDVLAKAELEGIIGNGVSDGVGLGFTCTWESAAEDTSASLLLQPVPMEFCEQGLIGTATDQFGSPGGIEYSDAGNIPGAQAGVCLEPGLVLVTITGGYGAASDEARYTDQAVKVMEVVLQRL
jgi:hypothetical protein